MTVVLGAHDLLSSEPEQQKFTVTQVFQNDYNPEEALNDVLLLQVGQAPQSTLRAHLLCAALEPWSRLSAGAGSVSRLRTWLCFSSGERG